MSERNDQIIYQDEEIDLFKLGKKYWDIKLTTGAASLATGLYAFVATPLYKATALVETGYYKNDNGEEILIANNADNVQKLTIKYIDLLKGVESLNYNVEKISELKIIKSFLT